MVAVLPSHFSQPALPSYLSNQASNALPGEDAADAMYGFAEYPDLFDAIGEIQPSRSLNATPYPVEDAMDVRATGELQPMVIQLEGAVHPRNNKAISTWATLLRLQAERTTVTLMTPTARYANMLLTQLSATHTRQTTGGLRALMTLAQIEIGLTVAQANITTPQASANFVSPNYQQTTATPIDAASLSPIRANLDLSFQGDR